MNSSPRYQGEEKLLVSIDLETTMSPYVRLLIQGLADPFVAGAVSYTTLLPGSVPRSGKSFFVTVVPNFKSLSRIVNRWHGREEAAGDSKVDPIIIRGEHSRNLTTFRFRLWWLMKVVARLHLVRMPLSIIAGAEGVFLAKWFKIW